MKNIVFITLDCVRPDHLGCFGYKDVHTPNINQLAEAGVLFEQAICSAPNTWVSHASIFTGCNPIKHGLHTPYDRISDNTPTIAEVLSENGYYTVGFPAHSLVGKAANFHRGFNAFYESDFKFDSKIKGMKWYSDWPKVLDIANEEIAENKQKPMFIWFHYMNTHHLPDGNVALPYPYQQSFSPKWQYYDGKISYADKVCVEAIVDILEKNGIFDDTTIIIFSDHGEELENSSSPKHDNYLFDDVLRILLLIFNPGVEVVNKKIPHLVGSIDIFPSILEMLHITARDMDFDGESFVASFASGKPFPKKWAYSENIGKNLISVRTSNWKLIVEIESNAINDKIVIHPKKNRLFKVKASPFEKEEPLEDGKIPQELLNSKVAPILRSLEASINSKKNVATPEKDKVYIFLKALGYV